MHFQRPSRWTRIEIHARLHEAAGEGMPEVMEADIGDPGLLLRHVEGAQEKKEKVPGVFSPWRSPRPIRMRTSRNVTTSSIFQKLWNYGNVPSSRRAVLRVGRREDLPASLAQAGGMRTRTSLWAVVWTVSRSRRRAAHWKRTAMNSRGLSNEYETPEC